VSLREKILNFLENTKIKGTILIAHEGINGTIAGTKEDISAFVDFIPLAIKEEKEYSKINFPLENEKACKSDFIGKTSYYGNIPFLKRKVKVKPEIVSLKLEKPLQMIRDNHYIEPQDWDAVMESKNTILIDTRNDFEYKIGTFENAVNPNIEVFSELPKWLEDILSQKNNNKIEVNNKEKETKTTLAMFCTGGARCDKLKEFVVTELEKRNLDKKYQFCHLKGGILEYLKQTKNKNQKWKGKCFVFDDRYAVDVKSA
jgi:UPF0176 protein